MKIMSRFIVFVILLFQPYGHTTAAEPVWTEPDAQHGAKVHLYFFWSNKCPHCLEAKPFIVDLEVEMPWLVLHNLELTQNPQHVDRYVNMSSHLMGDASSVPGFIYCGNLLVGYDSAETTGETLRKHLNACYQQARMQPMTNHIYAPEEEGVIHLPLIGDINASDYSLPVLTVLIAAMDAFNPCAFFVLLFLLSMMVHAHSRSRMLLIGGVFVFFSGFIYFIFMSAWLNVFLLMGELRLVTLIAGIVAVLIASFNIKDFFYFKKGVSLSISDVAKPKLFERIRGLLSIDKLSTVMVATIVLAIAANSYELLCTAGFPMVYTRILTLSELPDWHYYAYLVLYNIVYVIPLFVIVLLFTAKLGARKLTEKEGRVLKLVSGIMMLLLGSLLLIAPQALNNILVAMFILIVAILMSWLLVKLSSRYHKE